LSAVDRHGKIAKFSNYRETANELSAPGVAIIGHWGTELALADGTSFSAPLAAGTLALLRGEGASATQAIAEILKTAAPSVDFSVTKSLRKLWYGRGYLDAGAALRDWSTHLTQYTWRTQ
jgi:subtilisin family serine protease